MKSNRKKLLVLIFVSLSVATATAAVIAFYITPGDHTGTTAAVIEKIKLGPKKPFTAEIGGEGIAMRIQHYDPPYDEDAPLLTRIQDSDFSTPETSHFTEISATTVDWLKQCYAGESWKKREPSDIQKQLKAPSTRPDFFRFYHKIEFKRNERDYVLLFYGIDDSRSGGSLHKEGVIWYFSYAKERDGWKRDSFLSTVSSTNPFSEYFSKRLDELDRLAQTP